MPISRITGASIEDGSITLADLGITTIDSGTGNTLTLQANSRTGITIDVTGNTAIANTLTFSSTGARIRGDFSTSTLANRVAFQTSTANGSTTVAVLPNGTGVTGQLQVCNNSDPGNASRGILLINSIETRLGSDITGTGTYLPLTMHTGGSERLRIDTSGNVGIGTSTQNYLLEIKTNNVANQGLKIWGYSPDQSKNSNIYFGDYAGTNSYVMRFVNFFGGGTGELYGLNLRSLNTSVDFNITGGTEAVPIAGLTLKGNSGNVGINTTAPSQKLHVAAGTILSSNTAGTIATVSIAGNGSTVGTSDFALQQGTSSEAYVYNRANSYLVLGTNNTERMRITAGGNVGIGTNNPVLGLLDINGAGSTLAVRTPDTSSPTLALFVNAGSNGVGTISVDNGGIMTFDTGSTGAGQAERMRLTSGGDMLLGTTTTRNRLTVSSSAAAVAPTLGTASGTVMFTNSDTSYGMMIGSSGGGQSWVQVQRVDSVATAYDLWLQPSGGNVCIGTTLANAKFNVESNGGQMRLRNTTQRYRSDFSVGASGGLNINAYDDTGGVYQTVALDGNPVAFNISGSERMRIDSSGNVGIGTTSPTQKLTVAGFGAFSGVNRGVTLGEDNCVILGDSATLNNAQMRFYTANTERMRLDTSGNFLFNSGYGSVATAYGCRAWVNFNGTGTPSIRSSGNVSSISDNGNGDYTINFTTAMPDTNYAVTACAGGVSETGGGTKFWINVSNNSDSQAPTTSGVRIGCGYNDTIYVGCSRMHVAIFR